MAVRRKRGEKATIGEGETARYIDKLGLVSERENVTLQDEPEGSDSG